MQGTKYAHCRTNEESGRFLTRTLRVSTTARANSFRLTSLLTRLRQAKAMHIRHSLGSPKRHMAEPVGLTSRYTLIPYI